MNTLELLVIKILVFLKNKKKQFKHHVIIKLGQSIKLYKYVLRNLIIKQLIIKTIINHHLSDEYKLL